MTQPPNQGGFPPSPGGLPQHPQGSFPTPGQTPPPQAQTQPSYGQAPAGGASSTPSTPGAPAPFPSGGAVAGGAGGGAPALGGPQGAQAAGFMRSLFDFKFESFVSPRVLKVLYGFYLGMLVPAFFGLLYVWYASLTHQGFDYDTRERSWDPEIGVFCGATVLFPIAVFVYILMGRVLFERGILAFRQHALTEEMLEELRRR